MGFLGALRGAQDLTTGLANIGSALSRIADALERISPPFHPGEEEGSQVFSTDYDEIVALEGRQERFYQETGVKLLPGEEPPNVKRWIENG